MLALFVLCVCFFGMSICILCLSVNSFVSCEFWVFLLLSALGVLLLCFLVVMCLLRV